MKDQKKAPSATYCPLSSMRRYGAFVLFVLAFFVSAKAQDSHLATGTWFRATIPATGVYRVNASSLGSEAGCPITNLAVYALEGGQIDVLNSSVPVAEMGQIPVQVFDVDHNGLFDGSDYVVFYAEGADVWRYQSYDHFVAHNRNCYASNNYCYITTTATQSTPITLQHNAEASSDADYYTAVGVVDNDEANTAHSGQIWVGERFNTTTRSRTISVPMAPLVSGSDMRVSAAVANLSSAPAQFTVSAGGRTSSISISAGPAYRTQADNLKASSGSSQQITVAYVPQENSAVGYLDYLQVNGRAPLRYAGEMADMWMLEGGAIRRYPLASAPSDLEVWNVNNPVKPFRMKVAADGSFCDSLSGINHYVAFSPSDVRVPSEIRKIENQNLRGSEAPQLVIVSNPNFMEQAERLADIHRITDGMEVVVASSTQVYNEFSSGRPDPMAIRKMMRYYWNRAIADGSQKPQSLLIFGRGTYDNRNLLGNNRGCVVTYQSPASFDDETSSYCSDVMLTFLADSKMGTTGEEMDISVGRLPAATVAEATHLVDKIERYVSRVDLIEGSGRGDWRTYVTLLADDADPSCVHDTAFTSSSEYTAVKINQRYPYVNVDKIYADAYVQQSGAVGSYYPDVNNALKKRLNYGTLVLNYIGHGSVQYIGTERYMEFADIEAFANRDRLAFFVGSTCSYGRYDNPEVVSGAETFLLAENGGIGAVAASRPISHQMNYNTDVNLNLLNPDYTIGEAVRRAQNTHHQALSINLFGDPALRLSHPQKEVVVTRVNGRDVDASVADTGKVLSEVTIEGEIRNADGSLADGFNGSIYPIVYDRVQHVETLANDNDTANVPFTQQKAVLYKGRDTVADGRWSYTFVVPRDVAYEYDFGRLSHYARSGNVDAAGSYSNIVFGGFNQDADLSESRPEVRLFMGDTNFVDGGLVGATPTLYAVLSDKVGINAFGSGLGHDITAVLDGNPNGVIILNDFYETDLYDPRKGTVSYGLGKLSNGLHTLTLKAWNIYNYSNSATITFRVKNDSVELGRFYAYPNPATQEAVLHAEFNTTAAIESTRVDVYDMQGRSVASFEPAISNGSYVVGPVKWNLRNRAGNRVENGVYMARIIVETSEGERLAQSTKIVVY